MKKLLLKLVIISLIIISFINTKQINAIYEYEGKEYEDGNLVNILEKSFVDVYGKTHKMNSFKTDAIIMICGRLKCFNTEKSIGEIENFYKDYPYITIIEYLVDGDYSSETLKEYAERHPNVIVTDDHDNLGHYSGVIMGLCSGSTFPFVGLFDDKGQLRHVSEKRIAFYPIIKELASCTDRVEYKNKLLIIDLGLELTLDGNCAKEYKNPELYWYEKINGLLTKQGIYGDPKNIKDVKFGNIERGREVYDSLADAWYWLDADNNGAVAKSKEVWMPYIYQNEDTWVNDENILNAIADESNTYTEDPYGITANMSEQVKNAIINKDGKWVRYNYEGKMIKGWYTVPDSIIFKEQVGNTYYYDYKTGLMAKGLTNIGGINYYFDPITGVLQ